MTAKKNQKLDKDIYVYAHKNFSYKDALEFIRLLKRQCV